MFRAVGLALRPIPEKEDREIDRAEKMFVWRLDLGIECNGSATKWSRHEPDPNPR
jgi:hypothetical protein